jgi:type IV secretion system protein VirB6
MLTIYVALLGFRMLFAVGSARLAETPLIAVKIGAILAVTLNWTVFQTLVFDVDAQAPLQIARVISRPMAQGGGDLAENPVAGLQTAYDELTADAKQLSNKAAQNVQTAPNAPPPPDADAARATAAMLRQSAGVLVGSTAGVLSMAFIATGVLTAIGPVFIALFLFDATRGFFMGWVRALVGAMLTPMVCWIATSLLLVVIAPRIDSLGQQRAAQQINLDVADAACALVLIFAAAQAAVIIGALTVAAGFSLGGRGTSRESAPGAPGAPTAARAPVTVMEARSRAQVLAAGLQRTSATYSRDHAGAASGALRAGADADRPAEGARVERLGEPYRRGAAMRDRSRLGAAGRA